MPLDCLRGHSLSLVHGVGRYASDFDMIYARGSFMGTRKTVLGPTIGRFGFDGFDLYPWIVYGNVSDDSQSRIG